MWVAGSSSAMTADSNVCVAALGRPGIGAAHAAGGRMLERTLTLGLLFIFTGGHISLLFGPWPESGALVDEIIRDNARMSWLFIYLPLGGLLTWHVRAVAAAAMTTPALTFLVVAASVSLFWSISPEDTARRSLALLMTTAFGFYLGSRFELITQLRLVAGALSAATVLGLAVGLVAPDLGVMHIAHPGAWRGVFANKNQFGHVAALNCVALIALLMGGQRHALWLGAGALVALIAVALSESLTAWTIVAAVALVNGFVLIARIPTSLRLAGCVFLSGLVIIAILVGGQFAAEILSYFARDATLSGRTFIWHEAMALIEARPVLGYGYGALWTEDSRPIFEIRQAVGWATPNAHNGYLDLWLQLGLFGVLLFTLSLARPVRVLVRKRAHSALLVYWSSAFIILFMLRNLVESTILYQNDVTWVLYTALAATSARSGIMPMAGEQMVADPSRVQQQHNHGVYERSYG